ncbi:pyridoxamine 5-phosphate oxidase, FMN-binding protein, partial [Streptomyces sp. SPB074]
MLDVLDTLGQFVEKPPQSCVPFHVPLSPSAAAPPVRRKPSASLPHRSADSKDDEHMTHKMTDEEWRAFVSEGTRTAKLATVRADGSPHIAPIWFVLDGSDLVFNTGERTVKGRNLARDGRVALCVDDERPPFSFVTIEGS